MPPPRPEMTKLGDDLESAIVTDLVEGAVLRLASGGGQAPDAVSDALAADARQPSGESSTDAATSTRTTRARPP